jgi:hypothetical protein
VPGFHRQRKPEVASHVRGPGLEQKPGERSVWNPSDPEGPNLVAPRAWTAI